MTISILFNFSLLLFIILDNVLGEWGIIDKIDFIVTDNAANIVKSVEVLQDIIDINHSDKNYEIDSWGCFCHTLELILEHSIFKNT